MRVEFEGTPEEFSLWIRRFGASNGDASTHSTPATPVARPASITAWVAARPAALQPLIEQAIFDLPDEIPGFHLALEGSRTRPDGIGRGLVGKHDAASIRAFYVSRKGRFQFYLPRKTVDQYPGAYAIEHANYQVCIMLTEETLPTVRKALRDAIEHSKEPLHS